jgi:hypothetical protein
VRGIFAHARLVLREPLDFWRDVGGVEIQPCAMKKCMLVCGIAQGVRLGGGATIHPDNAGIQRVTVCTGGHNAVHLSCQREPAHGISAHARRVQ